MAGDMLTVELTRMFGTPVVQLMTGIARGIRGHLRPPPLATAAHARSQLVASSTFKRHLEVTATPNELFVYYICQPTSYDDTTGCPSVRLICVGQQDIFKLIN